MFRIEFPEILAWFQTPQTVSRPSRPSRPSSQTNSETGRPIEIFKKRKMIRIEFPKLLAWFQTPQTVSRPSRPNFQPHRTVEHTSQKLVSLQPPFTLKPRQNGAKTTAVFLYFCILNPPPTKTATVFLYLQYNPDHSNTIQHIH